MGGERIGNQVILKRVDEYYTRRLAEHGATHWGVDWNSQESQILRFDQLLGIVGSDRHGSILDYGCGYGAMARHLRNCGHTGSYHGFDISEAMIGEAQRQQSDLSNCTFIHDLSLLRQADYTIASGIYNVKQETPDNEWQAYVVDTIRHIAGLTNKGFSFNMLTSYSDPEKMRPDLFYGDPKFFIDHCIRTYSRHVAMLHNYGLYEFTILVRLR